MIFHWLFFVVIIGVVQCDNEVCDSEDLDPEDYEGYGCHCPVQAIMYYSVSVRTAYTASVLSLKSSGIDIVSGFPELDGDSPDWLTNIMNTIKEAYQEFKMVIHRLLQDLQAEIDELNGAVLYMASKFYKSDVAVVKTDTLVGEVKDVTEAESRLTARKLESAYANFQTTIDELRAEFQAKCDSIPAEYGTDEYYKAALGLYVDAKKKLMQMNELYGALRDAFLLGAKINKCSGTSTTDQSLVGIYGVDDIAGYLKVTNKCPETLLKTTATYMYKLYELALTKLYLSAADKSEEELALKIFIWEQMNLDQASTDLMYQELDCYITCTKDKALKKFGENSEEYNQVMSKLFVSVSTSLITIIKCTRLNFERAINYSFDGSMMSSSQNVDTKNIDLLYDSNILSNPSMTKFDYRSIIMTGQNNGNKGLVSSSTVNTNGKMIAPSSGNGGDSQTVESQPKTEGSTHVNSSLQPLMVNKCILQSIVQLLSNINAQMDTAVTTEDNDIEAWIFAHITLREFYSSIIITKQIATINKIYIGSSEIYLYIKFQSFDSEGYIGSIQPYMNDILVSLETTILYMHQPMSQVDDHINLQSINSSTPPIPYRPGQTTMSKPRNLPKTGTNDSDKPEDFNKSGNSNNNGDQLKPKNTQDMSGNDGSILDYNKSGTSTPNYSSDNTAQINTHKSNSLQSTGTNDWGKPEDINKSGNTNNNGDQLKPKITQDMSGNDGSLRDINKSGTSRPKYPSSTYMIKSSDSITQTIDSFATSFSLKYSTLSTKLSSDTDQSGFKTAVEKSLDINKAMFEFNTQYLQSTCGKWTSHIEQTMSADSPEYLTAINNIYVDVEEREGMLASFSEIPLKRARAYSTGINEYILIEQSVTFEGYVNEFYAFFQSEIPNTIEDEIDDVGDDPDRFLSTSVAKFTQIIAVTRDSLSKLPQEDGSKEVLLWQLEQAEVMWNDNVNNLKLQVTELKAIFGDSPSSLKALYVEIKQRTETLIAAISGTLIKSYSYCKTTTDFSVFESETTLIISESTFTSSYSSSTTTVYQEPEEESVQFTGEVQITVESYTETTGAI